MDTFISELNSDEPVKRRVGKIKKIDVMRWPLWAKIAVPTLAAAVIVFTVLFSVGIIGFDAKLKTEIRNTRWADKSAVDRQ